MDAFLTVFNICALIWFVTCGKTNSMETLLYWAVGICTASAAATVVAAYYVWKIENDKP